ncbi:PEP-CTERM domain protein [Thioalkalivibrio halophilus]|uniref:PEP-CTERM domain protein n=2 Tax=Ectothiorhodospiraceae TaxID=72276 RepID=A0A1V2ZW28_9GAMM|nr:NF038132 family protein [Thioalkalivibrio sp. ALE21]OOC09330.1 PEP-CTERM domain protein [Thioalkalivibrio halophilus]PYG02980.1 putative secreted protein [Thioalkalivibrio sp. ALE21]
MKTFNLGLAATGLCGALGLASTAMASPIDISGWDCNGNCGTSAADGDITLSPFGNSEYGWISTNDGNDIDGLDVGDETTGSTITSPEFSADEGDELNFYFNYVSSDGGGFTDYAWAQILPDSAAPIQLFTARTTPDGDTVPGFGLPEPDADVTLDPEETPVIPGAPEWSPLGANSGSCWDDGCGYTDWIQASYLFEDTGTYSLEFGVVNWQDTAFQSGLAFDGATIAGTAIGDDPAPTPVPVPASLALMGLGLAGLTLVAGYRRRDAAVTG